MKNRRLPVLLALAATFVVTALAAVPAHAGPPYYVGAYEADHEFSRITAADMQVIRGKKILFASRSFGLNCMDGLSALAAQNPMYALNKVTGIDVNNQGPSVLPLDIFQTNDLVQYLCTLNPWTARLGEIDGFIRNRYHDQIDAAIVYYHTSNVSVFPTYQATLDALRRDFPHIKIIYVTSGYSPVVGDPQNVASAEFGALVRANYMGTVPLYDMASILSTHSDGTSAGNMMCPEFNINGDNIHPNSPFSEERMGKAFLLMLYKIFCEVPLRADAGPDQLLIDSDADGFADVTLDGTASYVQDGTIVSYVWTESDTQVATGATPTVTLPLGSHTLRLTVTDDKNNSESDTVVVNILASQIHLSRQIAASGDDATTSSTSGGATGTIMYWPYNNDTRRVFLRWPINIPKGSTILSATIRTCSNGQQNDYTSPILDINLVNADSCPSFATNAFNLPVTSTTISWVMGKVVWFADNWYTSVDIGPLVQEFINRPGYSSGNYFGVRGMGTGGWKISYQWDYSDHTRGAVLDVYYTEPEPNRDPVARAGPDQALNDSDKDGSASVTLDGTASTDADGSIVSWTWTEGATTVATGPNPTIVLPVGLHTLTLTVVDNEGASAADVVLIDINAPPHADAGPDFEATADGSGHATVTLDGTRCTDSDGYLVEWYWYEGPTLLSGAGITHQQVSLPIGEHTITLELFDDDGATDTDTVVVTVVPPPFQITGAQLDADWVYQNAGGTAGRHQAVLTLTVDDGGLNSAYTTTVTQTGLGHVSVLPGADDLHLLVAGSQRTDGTTGVGTCSLHVTVAGDVAGSAETDVEIAVRKLGDINADGFTTTADSVELAKRLNGLVTGNRPYDLDGDGYTTTADSVLMSKILNAVPLD